MDEAVFQKIFDEVSFYLPKVWDKVIVYLEYGEDSYTFSFYVKINKEYIKCYDLDGINEDELMDTYRNIDLILSSEREKLKDKWTNMTMLVDYNLDVKTVFDYTDLSENAYSYYVEWKNKYLN